MAAVTNSRDVPQAHPLEKAYCATRAQFRRVWALDEFACVVAEYDDHLRSVKYTHPEGQPDDALHVCNYAHVVAVRQFHAQPRSSPG
jgi:hypothetical protein